MRQDPAACEGLRRPNSLYMSLNPPLVGDWLEQCLSRVGGQAAHVLYVSSLRSQGFALSLFLQCSREMGSQQMVWSYSLNLTKSILC